MPRPALSLVMPFDGVEDIDFALRLATAIALRELQRHPGIPPLYKSGVRWRRDPACPLRAPRGSCEPFRSPTEVLALGYGDCDDLVPWRTAELLRAGWPKARGFARPSPGIGYHVLVDRGDGTTEDPSRKLGMGRKG